jgi:hypothetical protein
MAKMETFIELTKKKLDILKELSNPDITKGDKIVLENELQNIEEKIKELEETTVSGDIAPTMTNLLSKKKDKKILKRPKLGELEELEESFSFSEFFDKEKQIGEFKK